MPLYKLAHTFNQRLREKAIMYIYKQTKEKQMTYSNMTRTELKALALSLNIEVTGDKRKKATYIDALEAHDASKTSEPSEPAQTESEPVRRDSNFDDSQYDAEFETMLEELSVTIDPQEVADQLPTPQLPVEQPVEDETTEKAIPNASIVMLALMPIVLLMVGVMAALGMLVKATNKVIVEGKVKRTKSTMNAIMALYQ